MMRVDEKETDTIINILFQADGGCPYCVARLLSRFIDAFPEHEARLEARFMKAFQDDTLNDAAAIWHEARGSK